MVDHSELEVSISKNENTSQKLTNDEHKSTDFQDDEHKSTDLQEDEHKSTDLQDIQPTNLKDLQNKDQGYAWVVVFSMFVSNILTVGYVKAFGIIYSSILEVYPDATGTMAGVMIGLLAGCRSIFSPFAGTIANRIGPRRTMLLGTVFYFLSLFVSFFCTTVVQLSITLGALIGISHCLIENSHVIVLPQYFESKLSFANGIRVAGNPFGGILYPLVVIFILQFYGLRSLFILLAAITAHIFVCDFLIRPFEIHTKIKVLEKINWIVKNDPCILERSSLLGRNNKGNTDLVSSKYFTKENEDDEKLSASTKTHFKLLLYREIMKKNKDCTTKKKLKKPIDLTFFKNPHYLLFIVLATGIPMGFPLGLYYTTLYARSSVGLPAYEVATILVFQSILDFFLRIFIGWLNNKNLYRKSRGFMICLWISAIGVAATPFTRDVWSLFIAVLLYTFGPASFQCFTNVILSEEFGKDNIASTWGFFRMSQGICSFFHSVILGYILDKSGSYVFPFLLMSVVLVICGLTMGIESPFKNYVTRAARRRSSNVLQYSGEMMMKKKKNRMIRKEEEREDEKGKEEGWEKNRKKVEKNILINL